MNCEKYKPTYILIALNVAIYIVGAIVGGNALYTSDNVAWSWGQVNCFVLYEGAYWQLIHIHVYPRLNIPSSRQHAVSC